MKKKSALLLLLISSLAVAGPILQMNRAFFALSDLIPYITDRDQFMEKKYGPLIESKIVELQAAFKTAKHDALMKEDLFAPSYALINENISSSLIAFKKGNKDYSHWRLKELTAQCLDCHTRLPPSYASSFQNGDITIDESKFENIYNLGIAQLIVRRYVDAKASFNRYIQDKLIKREHRDLILPFKQILIIDAKVLKNPDNLLVYLSHHQKNEKLPNEVRETLARWIKRLNHWKGNKLLVSGLKDDKAVESFIAGELKPLQRQGLADDGNDVDLLITSGLLSNYLFENPNSPMTTEISYWLGWSEKHLKRENFFGSGDLFLKQCIRRHSQHPVAKRCFQEYQESVEFEFTGSSGTLIPIDVKKELDELEKLIKKK